MAQNQQQQNKNRNFLAVIGDEVITYLQIVNIYLY
jgi:hypothetical protein